MGNLVEGNKVSNYSAGIRLGDPGIPSGNTFVANKLRMNACGVRGNASVNTFEDNKFIENDEDFCPP
jgi:hypothetical protein